MNVPTIKYPAKVLLFGEYCIIHGSDALIIPFDKFYGQWKTETTPTSQKDLSSFFNHVSAISGCDTDKLNLMKKSNWGFDSSIPLGYGMGSSGALSAATYEMLFEKEIEVMSTKSKLAEIESFFHGSSSGMDPLASHLRKPILLREGKISVLDSYSSPKDLYLYDSQKTRKSKPLIAHYKMMRDADMSFFAASNALSKFNSRIIFEITSGQDYSTTFKEISSIQYKFFEKMIPADIKSIWKEGLDKDSYYFKLSGAGGGGHFLVHTQDKENLEGLININD